MHHDVVVISGQFFIYFADIKRNINYSVLPPFYARILKIFQNVQSVQHSFNFFTHKRYYKRLLQTELKQKALFLYSERLNKKKRAGLGLLQVIYLKASRYACGHI